MNNKIGVVLVTYNRIGMLKKALDKFDKQTQKPDYVLIVNNASTDGTKEYLDSWQNEKEKYKKFVINLNENTGGSGGFYLGLKETQSLDADWIWVSDDDAFPKENALEEATKFLEKSKNKEKISAICAKIINNGAIDLFHRKIIKYGLLSIKLKPSKAEDYLKDSFEVNGFTYVGTILNKEILKQVGLTKKEYFIYWDDVEHAYRMSRKGKIIVVPKIEVEHNIKTRAVQDWKDYYYIRNKLDFYRSVSKKYFNFELLLIKVKQLIKKIFHYRLFNYELVEDAKNDAINNNMGKSKKYYPGWKYEDVK